MQQQGIIEPFLSALKAGDMRNATLFVAEDAVFVGVRAQPSASVPLYGAFIGHDGFQHFLETLRRTFSRQSLIVEHAIENGEVAFASGRLEHVVAATGKVFSSEWALRCRLRDGKIAHYQFFEDSARLEESLAAGMETP